MQYFVAAFICLTAFHSGNKCKEGYTIIFKLIFWCSTFRMIITCSKCSCFFPQFNWYTGETNSAGKYFQEYIFIWEGIYKDTGNLTSILRLFFFHFSVYFSSKKCWNMSTITNHRFCNEYFQNVINARTEFHWWDILPEL